MLYFTLTPINIILFIIMLISDLMKENIREQYLSYYPRNLVNILFIIKIYFIAVL